MVKHFTILTTIRKGCLLSPVLFNIVLDVLDRVIWQEKEIRLCIHIRKEKVNLSVSHFVDQEDLHALLLYGIKEHGMVYVG